MNNLLNNVNIYMPVLKTFQVSSVFTIVCGTPVAKFIVPDWTDKVDSGIGLSYRPARLHIGRYDNPMLTWKTGLTLSLSILKIR